MSTPPIVIGGTGGSGTRAVAGIVRAGGVFLGARVNDAGDSRPFARFDWTLGYEWVLARHAGRPLPEVEAELADATGRHLRERSGETRWGWKHPPSYLVLPLLAGVFPGLRFVHVIRDGRVVAFSRNRNQLEAYREAVLAPVWRDQPDQVQAVAFWSWANGLAADDGAALGDRYLLVRMEDVVASPADAVARLLRFCLDVEPPRDVVARAASTIERPESLTAWRDADPDLLRALDTAGDPSLRRFGYLA